MSSDTVWPKEKKPSLNSLPFEALASIWYRAIFCSGQSFLHVIRIAEIKKLFKLNEQLESIAVLDDSKIYGLIQESDLYRSDVSFDTPAAEVVNSPCLAFDSFMPLDQVSQLVTSRPRAHAKDDFIITHQGKFLGVASVIELLKKITKLQKSA